MDFNVWGLDTKIYKIILILHKNAKISKISSSHCWSDKNKRKEVNGKDISNEMRRLSQRFRVKERRVSYKVRLTKMILTSNTKWKIRFVIFHRL